MKRFSMSSKGKVAAVLFTTLFGSFYVPTIAQAGPGGGECGDENGWGQCGGGGFSAASACAGTSNGLRTSFGEPTPVGLCGVSRSWEEYQCNANGNHVLVRSGTVVLNNWYCFL